MTFNMSKQTLQKQQSFSDQITATYSHNYE